MSIVRALIVNFGVFRADNNIRRLIKDFALNYQLASNSVTEVTLDLAPGATQNFVALGSTVTILRCSAPVTVTYTLMPLANVRVLPVTVVTQVKSMIHLDDNIGNLTVNNSGIALSTLYFVQG